MKINTRFSVGVHILAAIALSSKGRRTSALLAKSVNTNSVVIRRVTGYLKKVGIVDSQPGVKGICLAKEPQNITLLDVYKAVNSKSDSIFDIHKNPEPTCYIGGNILGTLNAPLQAAQNAMEASLAKTTIDDIAAGIKERIRKNNIPAN